MPADLDTELLQAARNGDAARVQDLLDKGANVHAFDKDGNRPIHLAARFNKTPEVVELLLKRDRTLVRAERSSNCELAMGHHHYPSGGEHPLHMAAYNVAGGAESITQSLLDKDADVNAQDLAYNTPLHIVARMYTAPKKDLPHRSHPTSAEHKEDILRTSERSANLAQLLIAKGGNVQAKDKNGHTPLHHASMFSNIALVRKLDEADPDLKNIADKQNAIAADYTAIAAIATHPDITADIEAVLGGKRKKVDTLVDTRPSFGQRVRNGFSKGVFGGSERF